MYYFKFFFNRNYKIKFDTNKIYEFLQVRSYKRDKH